jgi:outer membrane protein assembly factor BamD
MYETKKYSKAIRLLNKLLLLSRQSLRQRNSLHVSQSYYKTKQYTLSGYQFESFVSGYPKSEKDTGLAYLGAKSYSILSPGIV